MPTMPKVEKGGSVTVITFTAGAIRDVDNVIARELETHTAAAGERHLMLDFTRVTYLNSVELGTLITLHKRVETAGGRLTLFNLSAEVFRLFAIARLDTLLTICREDSRLSDSRAPE